MPYTLSQQIEFSAQDLYSPETISLSPNGSWCVTSEGGVLVVRRKVNGVWNLTQSLTFPESKCGKDISIAFNSDSTILAIGTGKDSSSGGRVFVYNLSVDSWSLSTTLQDPITPSNRNYGVSVFLTNTTLTVGANNYVFVYIQKGIGNWVLQYKISSTGHCANWKYANVTQIENEVLTVTSVAGFAKNLPVKFRGNLIGVASNLKTYYLKDIADLTITVSETVGGPAVNLGAGVGEMQVEVGGIAGIENFEPLGFGYSVCMNSTENVLVVGAPLTNFHNLRTNVGAVCIYKKDIETWNLYAVLYDSSVNEYNAKKYQTTYNSSTFVSGSMFGNSLSINGSLLAIGAKGERYIREFINADGEQSSEILPGVGSVYLYTLSTLNLVKEITADQLVDDFSVANTGIGTLVKVSYDGSTVFISSPNLEDGKIFVLKNTSNWGVSDIISYTTERFGSSFAIDNAKNIVATDDHSIQSINNGSANSIYYYNKS